MPDYYWALGYIITLLILMNVHCFTRTPQIFLTSYPIWIQGKRAFVGTPQAILPLILSVIFISCVMSSIMWKTLNR